MRQLEYMLLQLLNLPSGPNQSLSCDVRMLSVCAIADNPFPGILESSGGTVYR